MALSDSDVELIRASWIPARADPVGAGLLLFKGLFTRFPDYLRFFNQFSDLDLESMQDNKRLIKHAVKVIDTVGFVVDSIGEPAKGDILNEALVNLVRGHLKRRIGTKEFRNLGIVLIDFICDLNNRRHTGGKLSNSKRLLSGSQNTAGANSSASSSQDSETMTSALDKIRASSSPSSSSEGENLGLSGVSADQMLDDGPLDGQRDRYSKQDLHQHDDPAPHDQDDDSAPEHRRQPVKLDTGLLVAAWTKLYGIILSLVETEESNQAEQ